MGKDDVTEEYFIYETFVGGWVHENYNSASGYQGEGEKLRK